MAPIVTTPDTQSDEWPNRFHKSSRDCCRDGKLLRIQIFTGNAAEGEREGGHHSQHLQHTRPTLNGKYFVNKT